MINQYLMTSYVAGGRGPDEYDCWGLVRQARFDLFGGEMLPMCATTLPGDIAGLTREVGNVCSSAGLHAASGAPGDIATAWKGKLCVHVGLVVDVDGQRWILETDKPTGPCLTRIAKFESRYTRVKYYAN